MRFLYAYFQAIVSSLTHLPHFVETRINTPSESAFIDDHNGTFIFSIGLSCAKL